MPDDMEEIEARLAAYVDGTLPAEQRAEIEAYLKANATHARLISELRSIRSAVVNLPKERAPAEVLDALQAQLERHTLLGERPESDTLKINRWPQLGAVAAVLLLAAGLGVLVYQVLPGQRKANSDLAILTNNASRPGDDTAGGVTLDDTGTDKQARLPSEAGGRQATPMPQAAVRGEVGNGLSALRAKSRPDPAAATNHDADDTIAAATLRVPTAAPILAAATSMPAATLSDPLRVIVVRSDDPALTQNLLLASLTQAGTAFELADWPADRPTATRPAGQAGVADWVRRLEAGGELAATEVVPPKPAKPIVLRGINGEQAYALKNRIAAQRPGRQEAEWAHDLARRRAMALPAVGPRADATAATRPLTLDMPTTSPSSTYTVSVVTDSLLALDGATVPAERYSGPSDLLILVIDQSALKAMSILPAVMTAPATRPSTSPLPPATQSFIEMP